MSRRPLVILDPEEADDNNEKKPKKVTWDVVFRDFKKRYNSKFFKVMKWEGAGYATLRIFLHDGSVILYDYDTKEIEPDPKYLETEDDE